jgi:hypothetical protein
VGEWVGIDKLIEQDEAAEIGGAPANGAASLVCPECGKPCANATGLASHRRHNHSASTVSSRSGSDRTEATQAQEARISPSSLAAAIIANPRCVVLTWRDAHSETYRVEPLGDYLAETIGWELDGDETWFEIASECLSDGAWRGLTYVPRVNVVRIVVIE